MSEMTAAQRDKLVGDLRTVIGDAEELLKLTAGEASEGAAELRENLRLKLLKAKDALARMQETAITRAKEAGHAADDYVHENPWRSIGIAAGVGLVVGLLIGRR